MHDLENMEFYYERRYTACAEINDFLAFQLCSRIKEEKIWLFSMCGVSNILCIKAMKLLQLWF